MSERQSEMKYTLVFFFAGVMNVCSRLGAIAGCSKRALSSSRKISTRQGCYNNTVFENLGESTLMCAGEFSPVIGGISWDGDIDEIVCKCTTRVGVWIAHFDVVDERHGYLGESFCI